METMPQRLSRWINGRLIGINAEIDEIEGFLNKYAEEPTAKDKVARYRLMLACRLHTKQEMETMIDDLSSLFETE